VQQVFPELVSTTSATALTPGGTLGLNYIGLIAPIVKAIQALEQEIASIETTVAGFAQNFTTHILTGDDVTANSELCVGGTCVTPHQFAAMVAAADQPSTPASAPTQPAGTSTTPTTSSTPPSAPPVIQINGDNPAHVMVGATYQDLGATITGPTDTDKILGLKYFLTGALVSNIVIDTSQVGTETIDYVATDPTGLIATSTRTVIIEALSARRRQQ